MLSTPLRHLPAFMRLRARSSELRQRLTTPPQPALMEARRLHQLGDFLRARRLYDAAAACGEASGRSRQLAALTHRHAANGTAPWRLVWQAAPGTLWESAWLRLLLCEVDVAEEVDLEHRAIHPRMIVVDSQLSAASEAYYRRAFDAGATVVLLHLGDEWYRDDCAAYRWCNLVIRNYWGLGYDGFKDIIVAPVGYRAGFARPQPPPPADSRRHLWCFAGDPYKSTRADMLEHMRKIGEGREHLSRGFNNSAALPIDAYRDLLETSVFVPAPCGNENLESFRAWEALEAGAIPIVERRPGYDYFREWLGDHPLPTVTSWREAPTLIASLRRDGGFEAHRQTCQNWWEAEKARLRSRITAAIATADRRAGRLGMAASLGWA